MRGVSFVAETGVKTEKEKQEKHLRFLVKIGMLIPFDERFQLYHGRMEASDENKPWSIDVNFDNSENKTGNDNVMGISCLCTASKEIAQNYAVNRSLNGLNGKMSIYKVEPNLDGCYIFNEGFDFFKLNANDQHKLLDSLSSLQKGIIKQVKTISGADINGMLTFEIIKNLYEKKSIVTQKDLELLLDAVKMETPEIDFEVINNAVKMLNTRALFIEETVKLMSQYVFGRGKDRGFVKIGNEQIPVSMESLQEWLTLNNVIALRARDKSTEERKKEKLDVVYIWALDKIKAYGESKNDEPEE